MLSFVVVQTGRLYGEQISRYHFFSFLIPLSGHSVYLMAEGDVVPEIIAVSTKRLLSHDMRNGGRTGQTSAVPQTD